MQDFWFYLQLGLHHVLDIHAYDHILFLAALALPYTFKSWKKVLILATVFTVAHCTSLALSVYGIFAVEVGWIEFLIPVTILATAMMDLWYAKKEEHARGLVWHLAATGFFGLIHGFGFSNYFHMLMAEIEEKLVPLIGFAGGIEISQVVVILCVLLLAYIVQSLFGIKQHLFITVLSIIIIVITIPMLVQTFPL
ncbi:HupE/UreJ family protein [Flavobacteriaceae bacterium F89]|uniref:HupE/UreJ family protein n=1 Tax=Cerina litoralis TaxID=2874477 RepID=A0AAE3JQ05_9FLAO|nr:HupE/UreJ family protein [Cerina litoralis]MCG2461596.1 HupE/UreJ family protein [Cerina litoralis]